MCQELPRHALIEIIFGSCLPLTKDHYLLPRAFPPNNNEWLKRRLPYQEDRNWIQLI